MTVEEYEAVIAGSRTPPFRAERDELPHAAMGLAGEAGEVVDIVKKGLYQKKLSAEYFATSREHLLEELGDCYYHIAWLLKYFDFTQSEMMEYNVEKLMKRYPERFVAREVKI